MLAVRPAFEVPGTVILQHVADGGDIGSAGGGVLVCGDAAEEPIVFDRHRLHEAVEGCLRSRQGESARIVHEMEFPEVHRGDGRFDLFPAEHASFDRRFEPQHAGQLQQEAGEDGLESFRGAAEPFDGRTQQHEQRDVLLIRFRRVARQVEDPEEHTEPFEVGRLRQGAEHQARIACQLDVTGAAPVDYRVDDVAGAEQAAHPVFGVPDGLQDDGGLPELPGQEQADLRLVPVLDLAEHYRAGLDDHPETFF